MSADEIAHTNDDSNDKSTSPSTKKYKFAIGILAALFVTTVVFHYTNPEKVFIEPQKDQLVEFNGDNYSKDELIAKVKAGQSRVAEAYTFGAFFCKEMVGKDGGGFKFANSVSSVQGMTIIVDMDCHTMDGGMQKYRTTFDQQKGTIVTTFRSGPSLAA